MDASCRSEIAEPLLFFGGRAEEITSCDGCLLLMHHDIICVWYAGLEEEDLTCRGPRATRPGNWPTSV